jgi:YVTN family beta-propeller protein
LNADGSKAYVTNWNAASVSIISTASNSVIGTIPVGNNPIGICRYGSTLYVANLSSNYVSVLNSNTDTVTTTVAVGSFPQGVTVSQDGAHVYVATASANAVSVINTSTNTVSATIAVGTYPEGIDISPDGSKVYVVNRNSSSVSVINTATNTVSTTISVGTGPISFGKFMSVNAPLATNEYTSTLEMTVYPNPTTGKFAIDIPDFPATISVVNALGQVVLQTNALEENTLLELNQSGLYWVTVSSATGITTKKLLVR